MAATPTKPEDPDDWTIDDAVALRQFIGNNPKFLRVLNKRRPKIEGVTMEARAVSGSDMNGFLIAIDAIDALQRDPNAGQENAGYLET